MSVDSAQRAIAGHQHQITKLQEEKGREAGRVANALKMAAAAEEAAIKTSSSSTRQSKLRNAQRHREDAAKHQNSVAGIESKIAAEQRRLNDAQKKLLSEQESALRRQRQDQERASREHEREMKKISGTLARHTQMHATTQSVMDRLQLLPEQICVLFLAANPLDREQLQLDEEVRLIGEMIRKSQHREAVRLESRWALRPSDLLQAINETKPRIVHFSGHGSDQDEIIFQNDHGGSKPVSTAAIVQTMAADAGSIQLVFFNTCYSCSQAEAVTQHVPAAIGMSTDIGDEAARVFSSQFYSAIGFGHSVHRAFEQAKAMLMLHGINEEATPKLFLGVGFDADELVFVRPPKS